VKDSGESGRSRTDDTAVGLCVRCEHSEPVISSRGSRFYLCRLSITDPRFPKYPRLPVVVCPGFAEKSTP